MCTLKEIEISQDRAYWPLFAIRTGNGVWLSYTDWSRHAESGAVRLIPQHQPNPASVSTRDEVIEMFGQREWVRSLPVHVHPEFRLHVKSFLFRRTLGTLASNANSAPDPRFAQRLSHWQHLLSPSTAGVADGKS